jgi:hypothetical protein
MGLMSDYPISVPVPEQTEEQKAEQEKQFRQADLIKELSEQLKPWSSTLLVQAKALQDKPTQAQLQSLADEIDQLTSAGRNAQGRMDSFDCPKDSNFYKAVQNLWEYCELAHHDAKQAANAADDNAEVRGVAYGNMMQNLEQAVRQIQHT